MEMIGAAVVTASDRSWRGEREDVSGRVLQGLLRRIPARLDGYRVVPDRVKDIRSALREFSRRPGLELIMTTGGTGVTPRDLTPEATLPLLERELPGLSLAIRWASFARAPASIISRAAAGFRGDCLIVNMPGSPRAVRECFEILLPTLKWLFARRINRGRTVTDHGPDRLS